MALGRRNAPTHKLTSASLKSSPRKASVGCRREERMLKTPKGRFTRAFSCAGLGSKADG